jgi:hypothetical protein
MNILWKLADQFPALEQGQIVSNPTEVKKSEQVNGLIRLVLSLIIAAAVAFGWLPEGTDAEPIILALLQGGELLREFPEDVHGRTSTAASPMLGMMLARSDTDPTARAPE